MPRKGGWNSPPVAENVGPSGRTKWVPTVVGDVASGTIVRWKREVGVLAGWGNGGREFHSWEGPSVRLWRHEIVDVLTPSARAQNGHPKDDSRSRP